jgi:hypothetical protein
VLVGVKAFAYATLAVTSGLFATIWAVRTTLGIETVRISSPSLTQAPC